MIAANDDELLVLQAGRHDACCDVLKVGETGVERGKERRQPSEDHEQKIAHRCELLESLHAGTHLFNMTKYKEKDIIDIRISEVQYTHGNILP